MSRQVDIRFVSPSCALVSGYGTRDILTELLGGRPPVWAAKSRGWVVQPHRARDLVAILDHRGGYEVTITNVEDHRDRDHHDHGDHGGDRRAEQALW